MKVYLVTEPCDDQYYPDYTVVKAFLSYEKAEAYVKRMSEGCSWREYNIKIVEVEE